MRSISLVAKVNRNRTAAKVSPPRGLVFVLCVKAGATFSTKLPIRETKPSPQDTAIKIRYTRDMAVPLILRKVTQSIADGWLAPSVSSARRLAQTTTANLKVCASPDEDSIEIAHSLPSGRALVGLIRCYATCGFIRFRWAMATATPPKRDPSSTVLPV